MTIIRGRDGGAPVVGDSSGNRCFGGCCMNSLNNLPDPHRGILFLCLDLWPLRDIFDELNIVVPYFFFFVAQRDKFLATMP